MSFPLDHIVHLSAPGQLQNAVKHFQNLGFEVLPGGKHADGLTENALVVLEDGVYIELIQFIKAASDYPPGSEERRQREQHWWADMKEGGWIDFCLGDLTSGDDTPVADVINSRAGVEGVDVSYDAGTEGGRIKPDGEEIRWIVTFPSRQHLRGSVPFFCKDLTPRNRRVPWQLPALNPDAGEGNRIRIATLTLMTSKEKLARHTKEIDVVLGSQQVAQGGDDSAVWKLDSPASPSSITLELTPAKSETEEAWVRAVGGIGVWMVSFRGTERSAALAEKFDGVGRVRWES